MCVSPISQLIVYIHENITPVNGLINRFNCRFHPCFRGAMGPCHWMKSEYREERISQHQFRDVSPKIKAYVYDQDIPYKWAGYINSL